MTTLPNKPKRRRPLDATNLTRKFFLKRGYRIGFVERSVKRRVPGRRFPQTLSFDLWGFGDFVAFHPEKKRTLIVQSTVWSDWKDHYEKIRFKAYALEWLQLSPGHRIALIAWQRSPKRGGPVRRQFMWIRPEVFEDLPQGACSVVTKLVTAAKKRAEKGLANGGN